MHVEKQTHFALSATDFDASLARFRAEGIAFSDMKGTPGAINTRPDGMRAVFLQDPNGYWFEINDFERPLAVLGRCATATLRLWESSRTIGAEPRQGLPYRLCRSSLLGIDCEPERTD